MTIIAYRENIIAADRLVYNDDVMAWGYMRKIASSPLGLVGGACGHPALIQKFIDWLESGDKTQFQPPEYENWHGITITQNGEIKSYDKYGEHPVSAEYIAIGSGKTFAYGAFFAGSSAQEAVSAAIALHRECGGPADIIDIRSL